MYAVFGLKFWPWLCFVVLVFVCETVQGQVPAIQVCIGDTQYSIFSEEKAWPQAKDFCESLGQRLVSIASLAEYNSIKQNILQPYFQSGGGFPIWLGASDTVTPTVSDATPTRFTWVDNTKFIFTTTGVFPWGANEPNNYYAPLLPEDCVAIRHDIPDPNTPENGDFVWNDDICARAFYPMCERSCLPPTKFPTPNPTPNPTPLPTPKPTPFPTPNPTPFPTPNPTPFPTPNPTPFPTPNPTPSPTSNPTPFPTLEPTRFPTPNPTPFPTPNPTPLPTLEPTKFPTPNPTPFPTPNPTTLPTSNPTPFPTLFPTLIPTLQPTEPTSTNFMTIIIAGGTGLATMLLGFVFLYRKQEKARKLRSNNLGTDSAIGQKLTHPRNGAMITAPINANRLQPALNWDALGFNRQDIDNVRF